MFTFFAAKLLRFTCNNSHCVVAPHIRSFSVYHFEIRKCARLCKTPIITQTMQKFYYTAVAVTNLKQIKNELYLSGYEEPKRMNKMEHVKKIKNIFNCKTQEAEVIFQNSPEITYFSVKRALECIAYLETLGIQKSTIQKYPWLLTLRSSEVLPKIEILEFLKISDVNNIVPLLQLSMDKLKHMRSVEKVDNIPNSNRIIYFAEHLKCPISEVCEFVIKYEFVYYIPFQRVQEMVNTLIEAGVAAEHILSDGWILRYKVEMIKERLEEMKIADMKIIKPWMLRSSVKNFKSIIKRAKAIQSLLGEESVSDYLARRLECSLEFVKILAKRNPKAVKVKIAKMHEILNLLFEEGYTPKQVAVHLRVLENSINTIKTRLKMLKDRGIVPSSPFILLQSKKEFEAFIKKMNKHKANQNTEDG